MTFSNSWTVRGAAVAAFLSSVLAAPAGAQNLLVNPSFESWPTGWNVVQSSVTLGFYGVGTAPPQSVSAAIGGQAKLLVDGGGNAIIEQTVSLASVPANHNLRVGGFFGGNGNNNEARLVIYFLDAANQLVLPVPLDPVTAANRNTENVLMLRERIVEIPPGAVKAKARVEFVHNLGTPSGYADALFIEATPSPVTPAPLPIGTELVVNGSFESGWAPGSPLTLNNVQGWEGQTTAKKVVKTYSNFDSQVPGTTFAAVISGGASLLTDQGGGGSIRQRFDVRGNVSQFMTGSLAFQLSAYLGGVDTDPDSVRAEIQFLNASFIPLLVLPLGPVTTADRNSETVLLKRERTDVVPVGTHYITLDVFFLHQLGSPSGLVDRVSARLIPPPSPTPIPLNTNLIVNGSFESGPLPGSPLTPTDPKGWFGLSTRCAVLPHGSIPEVPVIAFAVKKGLGTFVLKDQSGAGGLGQVIDVSADAALIDIGRYRLFAEAWLGGTASDPDGCKVDIQFLNANDGLVGGGLHTLPAVTAAERNNQTELVARNGDYLIPTGTKKIRIELRFIHSLGSPNGLADDIRLVAYDTQFGTPENYPGTGDELTLYSGINVAPTTGPGMDVKDATSFDLLQLRIESTGPQLLGAPLLLAANLYPTGTPAPAPTPGFPGLILDPNAFILIVNGLFCSGAGCPAVQSGGTNYAVQIPPGLAGYSILLQAFAVPALGTTNPPLANGLFAGSEGHEIRVH